MAENEPTPDVLTWDQRQLYGSRYLGHASTEYCNICEVPAPCPAWEGARDRLKRAGLLDAQGRLRPGVLRRGNQ